MEELLRSGKYDQARAKILAGEAGDADGLAVLIELRDWLRAKEYDKVRKVLQEDGDLVQNYLDLDRVQQALTAFESDQPQPLEAFLEDPHLGAEAWSALALLRVHNKDQAGAKAAFEESLRRDPGHYRAKTNLGNLALEQGQTQEAIQIYEEVLKHNPDFGHAHHNLGAAYRKLGKLDKSVYHIKRGQRLQMQAARRPQRGGASSPEMPRSFLGLGNRWWIWLVLIVLAYMFLNR